ncbi:MAG: DHH family phosphoesterase [Eubacteriales bacterium]|nr:DHH family phosphoesterase [Eubacteriales bacterium]MCI6971273.1 DHH family phosphoesterase [Eubacterium sp.]MDD7572898.1 DHH family phosphoesterase [Eubacteriales bacterium]MDY5356235.1 DHH family phosphoesterase [Eubacteriales bacterium]
MMKRRTKVTASNNITINGIRKVLERNDNFLVFMHENPDSDTIGSALALVLTLRSVGKRAYMACCDKIPQSLMFLTDGERCFGIEDLPGDFTPKFLISVDIASPNQLGKYHYLAAKIDLALDHHSCHDDLACYRFVDSGAGACAEIIYRVINRMIQGKIPEKTASLLYAALAADTGGFRYANTTPYTHKIAAKLIECGANHFQICRNLFEMKSKTALAAEAFAMENVKYLCGGKISYVRITEADKERCGFEDEDTYDVINVIRRVEGVKVAILARERTPGVYKISTRSTGDIDMAKICAMFGGGGHAGAAGCSVAEGDVDETVDKIIKECGFEK